MADAVVVADIEVRRTTGDGREPVLGATGDVVEQHDDRARVHARRPQQLVAVLLGAAEGALVGQDPGVRSVRLETEAREVAALGALPLGSRDQIALLIDIDRWLRILPQRAVRAPRGQRPGSAAVTVVRPVPELFDRQIETNDIGRVACEQAGPPLTIGAPL